MIHWRTGVKSKGWLVLRKRFASLVAGGCAAGSLLTALPAQGAASDCQHTKIIQQVSLHPPGPNGRADGIAEITSSKRCGTRVAILAQHLAPNSAHNAYAVWLYSSQAHCRLLGFVSPAVGRNGRLRAEGILPRHWRHFHHLVLSRERRAHPQHPRHIVLIGRLVGG